MIDDKLSVECRRQVRNIPARDDDQRIERVKLAIERAELDGGAFVLVLCVAGPNLEEIRNLTVNFTPTVTPPVTPSVPEPATWAMMISGFGLVGGAMRRRSGQDSRAIA